jgi:hypothetical protein
MRRLAGIGVLLFLACADLASAGTTPDFLIVLTDDHG